MQTEKALQEEFQQLITEVSKEVLDLSISKSMENAAYSVKEQVPALTRSIDTLKKVLDDLKLINEENLREQQEVKARGTRIDSKLADIQKKLETEYKSVVTIENELSTFKDMTLKEFDSNTDDLHSLRNQVEKQSTNLKNQLTALDKKTVSGIETGLTTKTILKWTLAFGVGSFGILIALLLHTLNLFL